MTTTEKLLLAYLVGVFLCGVAGVVLAYNTGIDSGYQLVLENNGLAANAYIDQDGTMTIPPGGSANMTIEVPMKGSPATKLQIRKGTADTGKNVDEGWVKLTPAHEFDRDQVWKDGKWVDVERPKKVKP